MARTQSEPRTPSYDFFCDCIADAEGAHPLVFAICMRLLRHQWSHGAIPDPDDTRRLIQVTGVMQGELEEHLPQVLASFEVHADGRVVNEKLQEEHRRQMQIKETRSSVGKLGGRPKAKRNQKLTKTKPKANQKVSGVPDGDLFAMDDPSPSEPRPKKFDAAKVDLPFTSPEFVEAWTEFVQMRKETKKPIKTETGAKRLLKTLKEMGEKDAIAALHHSTANEYQGVFAPDPRKPSEPERPAWKKATPIPGLYGATA